jgi:hypothetical protein
LNKGLSFGDDGVRVALFVYTNNAILTPSFLPAQQGDRKAKTVKKLLKDHRFDKGDNRK